MQDLGQESGGNGGNEFALAFGARLTRLDQAPQPPNAESQANSSTIDADAKADSRGFFAAASLPAHREQVVEASDSVAPGSSETPASGFGLQPAPVAPPIAAKPAVIADPGPSAPSFVEPVQADVPPASVPSAHQIVVRVAPADAAPVDLQVTQRAGEVHVAVRTPDLNLQSSLRQDLPELVNSLERAGYRAETYTPHAGTITAAALSETNPGGDSHNSQSGFSGRDSSQENPFGNPSRQQQQPRDQRQQRWFDAMEKQS